MTALPTDLLELRERAVDSLRSLVRIPSVSHEDPALRDRGPFDELHRELAALFPLLFARLERTDLPGHALLLRWPGSTAADPVVLMAHLDVVPVGAHISWQHPPWSGQVADGHVWGRGTLDDKGAVVAICLAVERLLEQGRTPARDVWISLGTTEEVSGETAALAVDELERRGVRPWFVLDEGGAVAGEAFPGVAAPVAVIGVAEKGTTTLRLEVQGRGGHASTPVRLDATARLSRAVLRLDRHPMRPRLLAPVVDLLARLAPHAPDALGFALSGAHRLGAVLPRILVAIGPETAAMTRTTIATTMLSGSPAHNVIAANATATLNVRVLPGDTVDGVVAHVRRTVRDDRVEVSVLERGEASGLSPADDDAFRLLERTVGEVFPDAVATPYLAMAATDSRFFERICPRVYRFTPLRMSRAQRQSLHSYDEHVGVDDLADGVLWFQRLIEALP